MLYPSRPLTLPPPPSSSLQINASPDLAANRIVIQLLLQLLLCCALHGAGCNGAHVLAAWPRSASFEADLGSRFTFRCGPPFSTNPSSETAGSSSLHSSQKILWKKDNQPILQSETGWHFYRRQMTLLNPALKKEDAGNYTCQPFTRTNTENESSTPPGPISSARLVIRTFPSRLANVSVRPSQVFASVRWSVADGGDGGSPITHFTLVYQQVLQAHFGNLTTGHGHGSVKRGDLPPATAARLSDISGISNDVDRGHVLKAPNETMEHQHHRSTHLPLHISPAARQYFVYHLRPNALYQFKMWATNRLGSGEPSLLYISTNTVQKKSHNGTNSSSSNQVHNINNNKEDITKGEALLRTGATRIEGVTGPTITVMGYADDDLSATAWIIAVTMVFTTVVVLALLSCVLIYKEASNDDTALVSMYEGDPEPASSRLGSAGFHSSAAAMQILLDPARSFRRFYRPQRAGVLEERTVLLAEVASSDCNDNLEPPPARLNNNSVLRPLAEEELEEEEDSEQQQHHH